MIQGNFTIVYIDLHPVPGFDIQIFMNDMSNKLFWVSVNVDQLKFTAIQNPFVAILVLYSALF